MSRADEYARAFTEQGGDDLVGTTRLAYLAGFLESDLTEPAGADQADLDTEVAYGFESLGLRMLRGDASEAEVISVFESAFRIRSALWSAGAGAHQPEDLWLLLVSGTLAQRQPELRLLLSRAEMPNLSTAQTPWDERLWQQCLRAAFRLCRRIGSWSDVDEAIVELRSLAETQREAEANFLEGLAGEELTPEHCRLLGLYHLAESLLTLGNYVRTGRPSNVLPSLQRHGEHVRLLLGASRDISLERIGQSVEAFTAAIARASIWFNASRISDAASDFVQALTSDANPQPVSELWWSQRTALRESLLDPVKMAVSVQMPTSAGKTLLAEFAMVQALALKPESLIAYVVPTRALVNQITRRLREDFAGLQVAEHDLSIEAAVPAFELDPTEDRLLASRPNVLVTTPEKLDLLVRVGHQVVDDLSLVVVDEAHHISDTERGPRLELLLATLKHERGPSCHYLLLTPFLPNATDLTDWLGDDGGAAITLDWTPTEQVRALGHWTRRGGHYYDVLQLVPSHTQPGVWDGAVLELGEAKTQPESRKRPDMSASFAVSLSEGNRGGTLILTRGPGTAEERAKMVAAQVGTPLRAPGADLDLLAAATEYVASELGSDYPLVDCLQQGVAFHHAGLPPEIRSLIEVLLERELVKVVAGTTTLAQGVNFPLSSVIVETLRVNQGRGSKKRPLRYSEFWNIAGRAGRALKDAVGLVVYPSTSSRDDAEFRTYLAGEAAKVVSALADIIVTLDDRSHEYGLKLVRDEPTLSHFLQYLAHSLRVAGYDNATAQMEDLLRSSLVFHELRQSDRASAEGLVRWCREFLTAHRDERTIPLADSTGLSLPSIRYLYQRADPSYREPEFWQADHLFGADLEPLTHVVELLGDVPEMSLAPTTERGRMNARRVAGIVRDWVTGKTLPEIADSHFGSSADDLQAAGRYLFRELTRQVPWGMGALQTLSLSSNESDAAAVARRTPALAFYGVDDVAALPLRMVGVPRASAVGLSASAPEFTTFAQARQWIEQLRLEQWEAAVADRSIGGAALRRVWAEIGGTAA